VRWGLCCVAWLCSSPRMVCLPPSKYSEDLKGGSNFPTMLRSVRQQFNLESEDRYLESEVVKLKDLRSWYQAHWAHIRLPAHILPMRDDVRSPQLRSPNVGGHHPMSLSDLIDRANHNMSTDLWESLYQNGSGASSQAESEYGDVLQPFERHSCGLCQQTHHLSIDLCAARRQLEAEEEEDHQQAEALAKLATSV